MEDPGCTHGVKPKIDGPAETTSYCAAELLNPTDQPGTETAILRTLVEAAFGNDIDPTLLDTILGTSEMLVLPQGEICSTHGDQANKMYFVHLGLLDVIGEDESCRTISQGGFCGEIALFSDGAKCTATTCAAFDSQLFVLPKEVLCEIKDQHPHIHGGQSNPPKKNLLEIHRAGAKEEPPVAVWQKRVAG
jgi:hypothetical protein